MQTSRLDKRHTKVESVTASLVMFPPAMVLARSAAALPVSSLTLVAACSND